MLTIKTKKCPKGGYIGQLQNGKHWIISSECERVNKQDALHDAAWLRLEYLQKNFLISPKLYLEAVSLKRDLDIKAELEIQKKELELWNKINNTLKLIEKDLILIVKKIKGKN